METMTKREKSQYDSARILLACIVLGGIIVGIATIAA